MSTKIPYVGVIAPSGRQDVVEGVVRYAYPTHRWRVRWLSGWGGSNIVADVFSQDFDGIIVSEDRRGLAKAIAAGPWPTVLATDIYGNPKLPRVLFHNVRVGEIAAEYLLNRGFENFAVFGNPDTYFSDQRADSFIKSLAAAGKKCVSLMLEDFESDSAQKQTGQFIKSLQNPVAIFCVNDWTAKLVADTCHLNGLHVPEEVAILGVDNDRLICRLTYPPLSSVINPLRDMGFYAAQLLHQLMNNQPPAETTILLPPQGIVTRASTDVMAFSDKDITDALSFIRQNAREPITVNSILEHIPIGRRTLEKKFKSLLKRSPLDEIKRVRLTMAKLQLAHSQMNVPAIATHCGFSDARRFATVFKQEFGCSPTEYRTQCRMPQTGDEIYNGDNDVRLE